MNIEWQISDGYAGGRRPQSFQIPDSDILECGDIESAVAMLEEDINGDFAQKVSPSWDSDKLRKQVEKLFAENSDHKDDEV